MQRRGGGPMRDNGGRLVGSGVGESGTSLQVKAAKVQKRKQEEGPFKVLQGNGNARQISRASTRDLVVDLQSRKIKIEWDEDVKPEVDNFAGQPENGGVQDYAVVVKEEVDLGVFTNCEVKREKDPPARSDGQRTRNFCADKRRRGGALGDVTWKVLTSNSMSSTVVGEGLQKVVSDWRKGNEARTTLNDQENQGAHGRPQRTLEQCSRQVGGNPQAPVAVASRHKKLSKPDEATVFETVLEFMFDKLEVNRLLELRLVCKEWCTTVDNFVACHPLHPLYNDRYQDEPYYRSMMKNGWLSHVNAKRDHKASLPLYKFSHLEYYSDTVIDRFRSLLEAGSISMGRSPLIGKSIRFTFDWHSPSSQDLTIGYCTNDPQVYWSKASDLLAVFGKHVSFLWLEQKNLADTPIQMYRIVQDSLKNSPNLKLLRVDFMAGAKSLWTSDSTEKAIQANLEKYQKENPLPALPQLESLQIKNYDSNSSNHSESALGYPPMVIQGILVEKYHLQLRTLYLHFDFKSDPNPFPFPEDCVFKCRNLTELYLTVRRFDNTTESCLNVLRRFKCRNLQKFTLFVEKFEDDKWSIWWQTYRFQLGPLLRLLQTFPRLCFLNLDLPLWNIDFELEEVDRAVILPWLHTLQITSFQIRFDFLACFPNLRWLQIFKVHGLKYPPKSRVEEFAEVETVEINKYLHSKTVKDQMYSRSNVWRKLVRLEEIVFGDTPTQLRSEVYASEIWKRSGFKEYCKILREIMQKSK